MGVLNNKVAIITGAGRGIGMETALLFAKEGAKVVVNDLGANPDGSGHEKIADEVVNEINDLGGEAVANYDSVGTVDGGNNIFNSAMDAFGKADILVNNAGIQFRSPILDFSNENFELVLRTNLTSCFSLSREAIRLMKNIGGGRIINTVSMLGPQARPTVPAYIAAKEGLRALTRALAVEVGADGILVNAIAPGYIATELNTALLEDQEFSEWVISKTPLARWGQPHELGGGAVFLMSEAGSFVNGQVLSIDGGMSIQV